MKLCGIDEAGRGPLAGPMVVAGVVLKEEIKHLDDSKKISEKKREELFEQIIKKSNYHIVFSSAKQIDEKGISFCLKNSILEIINNIKDTYTNIEFLIDGNTSFGIKDLKHKIKADSTIKEVSAASILAKVSRDRYMKEIANLYPNYSFEKHKGYGTKSHIESIRKHGKSQEHRYTFKLKALGEEKIGIQKNLF